MVLTEEEDAGFEEPIRKMVTIRRKALENIQVLLKHVRREYGAKHSQDKLMLHKVRSLVLVRNGHKLSQKWSKMAPNWLGLYSIHEVLKKGTFRLLQAKGGKKVLVEV